MQCGEIMYHNVPTMIKETDSLETRMRRPEKETIHSGHFMVSHFEAEAQDDEDEVAVPVPEEEPKLSLQPPIKLSFQSRLKLSDIDNKCEPTTQQLSIETSLSKLFQCMSLAYRQKLTSPKWNRFKGIRLRWKEKIRLNNVIWRCWHMQFILKQNTLVCQFASPLDVDTHNKPEAVVLEGKYWKRKLAAVTAEYKKWRMFRRNQILGWARELPDMLDVDMVDWQPDSNDSSGISMMVDQDYMEFMSDTLFSTITSNQPFAFPDTRDIAKGAGLADFIQPSLVQLQPNLEEYMDTWPFQELLYSRLPPVPEEAVSDDVLRTASVAADGSVPSFPDVTIKSSPPSGSLESLVSSTSLLPVTSSSPPVVQPSQQDPNSLESLVDTSIFKYVNMGADSLPGQSPSELRHDTDVHAPSQVHSQTQAQVAQTQAQAQVPSQGHAQVQAEGLSHAHMHLPMRSPNKTRLARGNSQHHKQRQHLSQLQSQPQQHKVQTQPSTQAQKSQLSPPGGFVQMFTQPALSQSPPRLISGSPKMQTYQRLQQSQQQQQKQQPTPPPPPPPPLPPPPPIESYKQPPERSLSLPSASTQPLPQHLTYGLSGVQSSGNLTSLSTGSISNLQMVGLGFHEKNEDVFAMPKYHKLRTRSRSGSSLLSGGASPNSGAHLRGLRPLVTTASNPDLSSTHSSTLLTHLLTTSNPSVYSFTGSADSLGTTSSARTFQGAQTLPPMSKSHQLPMLTQQQSLSLQSSSASTQMVLGAMGATSGSDGSPGGTQGAMPSSPTVPVHTPKGSDSASDSSTVPSPMGLSLSPLNMDPMSPPRSLSAQTDTEANFCKTRGRGEHRRVCHINAEQKRRCNIKNGFDTLHQLIPQLNQNPNTKMSKASMLQKGAEYISQLRNERSQLSEEMESLRKQIDSLNTAISNYQSMLPATGAPVSRQRSNKMREMFDEYVRLRTMENWKFWIFSLILEPLLVSFSATVSTASMEDLYRTTLQWVEQHCSLVDLRPVVLNSLRYLCTATDILSEPSKLPEEARQAVLRQDRGPNTSQRPS